MLELPRSILVPVIGSAPGSTEERGRNAKSKRIIFYSPPLSKKRTRLPAKAENRIPIRAPLSGRQEDGSSLLVEAS